MVYIFHASMDGKSTLHNHTKTTAEMDSSGENLATGFDPKKKVEVFMHELLMRTRDLTDFSWPGFLLSKTLQ